MTPEILIVGDPAQHDDLIRRVRECQYEVGTCQPRELNRKVRMGKAPAAIIICISDSEPALLLAGLRRSRAGAAIPVILHGSLGGEIRDLADVLDLGADQFLEEPVDPPALHDALAELAGPASGRTETGIIAPPRERQPSADLEPSSDAPELEPPTTTASESTRPGRGRDPLARPGESREFDTATAPDPVQAVRPALGNLHQTLDRLEARLRERDRRDRASEADGIDLESMGLENIPDVDAGIGPEDVDDPADSGMRRRLLGDDVEASDPARAERASPAAPPPAGRRAGDTTELLERGSGSHPRGRGRGREETRGGRDSERSAVTRGRRPGRGPSSRAGSGERDGEPAPAAVEDDGPWMRRSPRSDRTWKEVEVAEAGKIVRGEVPKLLWKMHDSGFTGSVSLQRERVEKRLWFEHGEVRFVRSNDSADRFVDGLLRRGVLTRPQYETARRLAAKEPRRVGKLLVEAGFLKSGELAVLLRDHLARVMDGTFAWDAGSYRVDADDRCDESIRLELPMAALILEGVRHRIEVADLRQMLWRDAGGELICPELVLDDQERNEAVRELAEILRLLPDEEVWLHRFDGRHPMAALLELHDDEASLLAVVYTMLTCGYIAARAPGSTSVSAPAVDDWTPAKEGDPVEIDGQRILDRLRLAQESDYYEFLGLGRDASRAEVRRAHSELRSTFSDSRLEAAATARWEAELIELRAALDEARDILLDDAMRSAYLAHLGDL